MLVGIVALLAVASGCHTMRTFKERVGVQTSKLLGTNFDDPLADEKLRQAEELYNARQYEAAQKMFRAWRTTRGTRRLSRNTHGSCKRNAASSADQLPEACDTYHKVLVDFSTSTGAYREKCVARMLEICNYWLKDFQAEIERRKNEKGVLHWHPSWPHPLDSTKPVVDQEGASSRRSNTST